MKDFLNLANKKYLNIIVFLFLEGVAGMIYFYNNAYPRSVFFSTANSTIAFQYSVQQTVQDYFALRKINQDLIAENTVLHSRLLTYQNLVDTTLHRVPSSDFLSKFDCLYARVVNKSGRGYRNLYTIDKGAKDGVKVNMGVCDMYGVVGVVKKVGQHYSIVVPLIHTEMNVSGRIARNRYLGVVQWTGESRRKGVFSDIAFHVDVHEHDTIVTSGLSAIYPSDIPIGEVIKVDQKTGASNLFIEIRFFANFDNIEHVYLIENQQQKEQTELEENVG